MRRVFLVCFALILCLVASGQSTASLPTENTLLKKGIAEIEANSLINVDSAYKVLSTWNNYPAITSTTKWYLYIYHDSIFGNVPLKVYIPQNYQCNRSSPVVLILHGAVVLSSFKDAYRDTASDEDLFYKYFADQNYIIIRPFADGFGPNARGKINFDWVVNRFNGKLFRNKTNPTYRSLVNIISQLKQTLNIDDNKVFAYGHSDGSDGVFALELYTPSIFSGFVVYNSMLTTLRQYDIYLRNTMNRPLYLVHSDLDDLRPIQQERLVMKVLDSLGSKTLYKEYIGYKHYDRHLQLDLPYSYEWMKKTGRDPFQQNITLELSDSNYNTCDWLVVTKFDTLLTKKPWHTELNVETYNKGTKTNDSRDYYSLNQSSIVQAIYNNNIFEIKSSRVREIELFINPVMVNLQNPVIVRANGKEVFNRKVEAEKTFMVKHFNAAFDRKAIWVTSIIIKTD